MTTEITERKIALIHRVIIQAEDYPKEYAVLITDRRSIFIHQEKTRSAFVLRREMKHGTALVTDVVPKTIADYEQGNTEALSTDPLNITIPHESVISAALKKDPLRPGRLDLIIRLTMRLQKEVFQVYNIEMKYRENHGETILRFYLVPLGAYFKPRRLSQTRETILREYAVEALDTFRSVIPGKILE